MSEPLESLIRNLAPQVLGAVIRRFRDFADAEDAAQEALIAAAEQWPREGIPENPRAWLIHVASRRFTDHLRSQIARRRRETLLERSALRSEAEKRTGGGRFSRPPLHVLPSRPHFVLSDCSTLRAVGGLTTAEIASAFLVPEATMAQRISRAKQTFRTSGVPFQMPGREDSAERLGAVLHVLYLIFNEGYTSSDGPALQRTELSAEAIRLTRMAHRLLPRDGEVAGLLALMLLTDARRRARTGPDEELIPLTRQDRTLWDQPLIHEGVALVSGALSRGSIGFYQLLAAIAAIHDEAARVEDTDWRQILTLYELLKRMSDNPMVVLNHAIASAMVNGPAAGLELLDALTAGGRLAGHHRVDAARAHLLEMAGDHAGAIAHYHLAAGKTTNLPERNYLLTQAATLRGGPSKIQQGKPKE